MNVLNLEARNAMDTRRMEHANAYGARSSGLIKSASTSTCCANENALFKKAHRRYFGRENADFDETTDQQDLVKVSLVSPLSLSHAAALARNVSLYEDDNAAKKTLKFKFRLNHLKHFSDCNLNNIGLPNYYHQHKAITNDAISTKAKETNNKFTEFNTHRALNNVLIDRTGSNGRGSIINFTAVNDLKSDSIHSRINGMSAMERVESENENLIEDMCPSSNSQNEVVINESTQRRRKNSIFQANQPQEVDEKETEDESPVETKITRESNGNDRQIFQDTVTTTHSSKKDESGDNQPTSNKEGEEELKSAEKEEKRFRRSSSLKMPKENDSTPAQKKIVRFADALGLDLADVRTFLDELPSVPKSAYSDLKNEEPIEKMLFSHPNTVPETKTLVPMFKQPHTSFNFLDRVRDNFVSLEYAKVCPMPVCTISGTVRVRNLDFCKSVYVRYSSDSWVTFNELQAVYVPDSCDGFSDKFAFVVYVYDVKVNQRVELAIRFHCSGSIFWDNNNGSNYVFQCLPSAPIVPSYFQCYNPTSDSCNSFY